MGDDRQILVVLPRLVDGRIILLGWGREAAKGFWELPAAPLACHQDVAGAAFDLLHSTTDYVPGRLVPLGSIAGPGPNPARFLCYLAEELRPSPLPPNHAGRPITTALAGDELRHLVRRGLVRCATLLSALALLGAADGAPQEIANSTGF